MKTMVKTMVKTMKKKKKKKKIQLFLNGKECENQYTPVCLSSKISNTPSVIRLASPINSTSRAFKSLLKWFLLSSRRRSQNFPLESGM